MGTATNSPIMALEKKHLALKRIGWLYPIFRDLHFYHGLLERAAGCDRSIPQCRGSHSESRDSLTFREAGMFGALHGR